jgi:hypothetical protein
MLSEGKAHEERGPFPDLAREVKLSTVLLDHYLARGGLHIEDAMQPTLDAQQ